VSDAYAIERIDPQPMAFAGYWEEFRWADGTVLRTFTIITAGANGMMAEPHARMPAILESEDWPTCFDEVVGDPATLLQPTADDVLKVGPVSKQVNSPKNSGADMLEAVG
jgi:putative SOS response-associated peptidase YedK